MRGVQCGFAGRKRIGPGDCLALLFQNIVDLKGPVKGICGSADTDEGRAFFVMSRVSYGLNSISSVIGLNASIPVSCAFFPECTSCHMWSLKRFITGLQNVKEKSFNFTHSGFV